MTRRGNCGVKEGARKERKREKEGGEEERKEDKLSERNAEEDRRGKGTIVNYSARLEG